MNMFSILTRLATNPRSILTMGLILIMAVVFIFGPRFGLVGWKRLVTILVLVLLLGCVQAVLAVRSRKKKKKAAEDLETSMIIEADENVANADDDQKRARQEARCELLAAIDVLKKSRLADGRGGRAALYALPWYLVLGESGAGKSAVIRNSGLQRPDQGPGDLQGISSSPNCSWWFTNQAVILEADRRFCEHVDEKTAEGEWGTFLELLAKHRARISINGVIVTISATELLRGGAGDLETRARLLRQRLDAMSNNLSQVFPVYVLVTKLDLLHGFGEYFSGIGDKAATQIFGATLRGRQMRRNSPGEVVEQEFDGLVHTVEKRRLMRLVSETNPALKDGTYLFPLEFKSLRNNLSSFIRSLCEENAYGPSPMLRGFYFTAAGGEGETADVVMTEVSQVIGLPGGPRVASLVTSKLVGHSLFFSDFFRRVLVPDRHIARPTRGAARRSLLVRRALQFMSLAALGVLGVLMTISFGRNLALVNQTRDFATQAVNVTPAGRELAEIGEKLRELDPLRLHLEGLDGLDRHHGLDLGLGLYRGGRVNERARAIYLERLRDALIVPSRQELEPWLNMPIPDASDQTGDDLFLQRYPVYRMLFAPQHGEAESMSEVLRDFWIERSDEYLRRSADLALIDNHIHYAMRHSGTFGRYCANERVDGFLKTKGNRYLGENWQAGTFYAHMIADVNAKTTPFALHPVRHSGLVSGIQDADVDGQTGTALEVPGSFTKAGWEQFVRDRILHSDEELKEDWLLREVFSEGTTGIRSQLLMFYVDDYRSEWNRFLSNIDLPSYNNLRTAADKIERMKDKDSSLFVVLNDAADNLRFDNLNKDDLGEEMFDAMYTVQHVFGTLHAFVANRAGRDDSKPHEVFREHLQGILNSLAELQESEEPGVAVATFTASVFTAPTGENPYMLSRRFARTYCGDSQGSAQSNLALRTLLQRPAGAAWRTCLRETDRYLDGVWESDVWTVWDDQLRNRYPFRKKGADASLGEFADFFAPEGRLGLFVTEHLAIYLEDDRRPKEVYDYGIDLGGAAIAMLRKWDEFKQVLFAGGGDLDVSCELTAQQIKTRAGLPPSFRKSLLSVGNENLAYDMGRPRSAAFHWPVGSGTAKLSVLCVEENCKKPQSIHVERSEWALFRLLELATYAEGGSSSRICDIHWELESAGQYVIDVPYRLKADRRRHPFSKNYFRGFQLHRSLAQ